MDAIYKIILFSLIFDRYLIDTVSRYIYYTSWNIIECQQNVFLSNMNIDLSFTFLLS